MMAYSSAIMGRKRTKHHSLPPRMHRKGKAYYYVPSVGHRRWIPLGSSLPEAKRRWADLEGGPSEAGTINALLDHYETHQIPKLAPKTQQDKVWHLKRMRDAFGHMPIEDLESWHIDRYLRDRSKPVAANQEVNTLSAAFSSGMQPFRLKANPCLGVKRNPRKNRSRYVTDAEFRAVYGMAPPIFQCLMDMAYMTGLRQGDLIALRWDQVEPEGIRVRQSKTGQWQYIERTGDVNACLGRLRSLHSGDMVFAKPDGTPYSSGALKALWHRLMRSAVEQGKLSERFTFHDLRAKCLTDAEAHGGLERSMPLGGHQTEQQHRVYLRAKAPIRARPMEKL